MINNLINIFISFPIHIHIQARIMREERTKHFLFLFRLRLQEFTIIFTVDMTLHASIVTVSSIVLFIFFLLVFRVVLFIRLDIIKLINIFFINFYKAQISLVHDTIVYFFYVANLLILELVDWNSVLYQNFRCWIRLLLLCYLAIYFRFILFSKFFLLLFLFLFIFGQIAGNFPKFYRVFGE